VKALLDANVLYSITLTDVMLSLAHLGFLRPAWTEEILEEAERHAFDRAYGAAGVDADGVRRRFRAMRDVFDDAMVGLEDYVRFVPSMRNHRGDRHVLAAAAAVEADVLVTQNVRHFPPESLAGLPVGRVVTPDEFLCEFHLSHPLLVDVTIDRLLARRERPRMTHAHLANQLRRAGAPGFAARVVLLVPELVNP
jgi:hypothetical protein